MNLVEFGKQLQALRKARQWSQEALIEALDKLARAGPPAEYRVIDSTLLSRWERAHTQKGRTWKPTRAYTLHLIRLFATQLDLAGAIQWAAQAGYQLKPAEVQAWFPVSAAPAAPDGANQQDGHMASSPTNGAPVASIPALPHNLPTLLTSFVGRTEEMARLLDYLTDSAKRLITIVGEGGVGKTRLALQVAHMIVNQYPHLFPDGVYFVTLAGVSNADIMVSALVNALGMALAGTADLEEQVLTYLRDRQLLMVLDNVEHLIASAGPLVMAILQAAPALHLLITSRERLNWAEEWVVAVTGLPFPMAQTAPSQLDPITPHGPTIAVPESNFLTYSAIQLFLARAQQMGIQFEPDRDLKQRAAIARICALVQGIPLGIEMAAAWVHILSYSEIGNEIAQNLDFLTSSQHDLPIRQRSMRAVFEHSWHLLSSREQEVLAALSVFQGGFQREAAAGVVDASLPMLRSLCDKSLLQWNAGRYALHELLRQFAAEKLQLTPMNEQRAQERHARYYLALAEEVAAQLRGADAMPLLDQLDKEQDNLRCVLLWSLTETEQMEIGLRLASALSLYWYQRGHWREGCTWLTRALAQTKSASVTTARARALLALGEMLWGQGDYHAARSAYEEALLCFRTLQDQDGIASVVSTLGLVAREQGDAARARVVLEESLANFRNQGNQLAVAWALCSLGEVAVIEEDAGQATTLLEKSLRLFQQLGDQRGIAWAYNHLGHVAQLFGEHERAMALHRANLAYFRNCDRNGTAWTINGLASVALDQGDYQSAITHYVESLTLFRELESKQGIAWCLAGLGSAAAAAGQGVHAARLWGAADALLKTIGARPAPATRQRDQQAIAAQRSSLGEATFTQVWDAGRMMTLPQAITYALTDLPAIGGANE